ncbi:ras-related and estrogen-regulated growth inhibitor-like protein [Frankliniella occidentalis]|uniref:small monomeric GTPase n=1 Tax=Frankliniella occidentalis TaxID=133901 RepID=A0A9C6U9Q3_FRAOC|nr:ras-related and estrogen-regulated growth inhibitor-like protein [Frankliniella occidentalis]
MKMSSGAGRGDLVHRGAHSQGRSVAALVVRFITRRFIGEYDPNLEKVYNFHTIMDNEMVFFEILDTAAQPHESECLTLEANIRWAEAFILMYSVTDKCSFDECNRLKFLINYNKRKRRLGSNSSKESLSDVPVVLVGNKIDQWGDRMVSPEDGQRRSKEIGCVCFHEISVREDFEQVWSVFRDVCHFWKVHNKCPKLKRSSSDSRSEPLVSPESSGIRSLCGSMNGSSTALINSRSNISAPFSTIGRRWTEVELDEEDESEEGVTERKSSAGDSEVSMESSLPPFRARASTDGHLLSRPRRWRYPPPSLSSQTYHGGSSSSSSGGSCADRRMSISMRGNNASY